MNTRVFTARARTFARAALLVCLSASSVNASLPDAQQSADIGAPAIRGSATYQTGKYTIKAAGTDIWDAADQFHFVYRPVIGDVDLRVRVVSLGYTDVWAKAGIMIRESLTADARHAFAAASAGAGYAFQRRPDPGGPSEHTSGGAGAPPGWLRLIRKGSQFQAYRSSNGWTWKLIGSDTIPMNETVYVGLAATSHNASASTTAVFDAFTVLQSWVRNKPPVVGLSTPAPGATYTAPANIVMTATASDPEGRLAGVDFLIDGVLVGTAATAPFSLTAWSVPAGSHAVTAMARDADGASTEAAPALVTVAAGSSGSTPFSGTPLTLPGTLQAEDFDNGGADVAYYDRTPGNAGGVYRPTSSVDIAAAADQGGGYTLGWVEAGEWLKYSVVVSAAGTYDLEVRVASTQSGGSFHVEANGVNITGPLTVPNTGGWQAWTTVRKTGVSLAAGPQVWRLVMDSNGVTSVGNFNWIRVSAGAATTSPPRAVAFRPSPDHAALVTSYVLRVFAASADPLTATPVASSSLGKPAPNAAGEIVVDRAAFFSALAPGTYETAIAAVGTAGESISASVTFTR